MTTKKDIETLVIGQTEPVVPRHSRKKKQAELKPNDELTATQQSILKVLREDHWLFPKANQVRACEALKDRGLAEAAMQLHSQNFARGTARFSRAFRRTKAGTDVAVTIK